MLREPMQPLLYIAALPTAPTDAGCQHGFPAHGLQRFNRAESCAAGQCDIISVHLYRTDEILRRILYPDEYNCIWLHSLAYQLQSNGTDSKVEPVAK